MSNKSAGPLNVKPVLLILLSLPSTGYAHGGPELFIVGWSIILLPVIVVTLIARKGTRVYWFLAAFGLMLVNVVLLGMEISGLPVYYHLFATWLLIPVVIWHRWVSKAVEKKELAQQ